MSKNMLQQALRFEQKGMSLYGKLAKQTKNEITRRLFESLAKQEKDHMEYIRAYVQEQKFKKLKYVPIEKEIKKVFVSLSNLERAKDIANLKAYEMALDLEDKGYKLYQAAVAKAKDKTDKKFFTFLMKMEQEHYSGLANVFYYYSNNDSWLSENESKTWNWMNF